MSDHLSVLFTMDCNFNDQENDLYKYNWASADFELINMFLQTLDWNQIFYNCSGTIDLWDSFLGVLNEVTSQHVPIYCKGRKRGEDKVNKLSNTMKRKWWKFINSALEIERINYELAKGKHDAEVVRAIRGKELRLFDGKSKDPKKLYNYIGSKLKNNNLVPSIRLDGDHCAISSSDKCSLFSEYFKRSFSVDNCRIPDPPQDNVDIFDQTDMDVTREEVIQAIKSLNASSSSGPGYLPLKLFINCKANLAEPIRVIANSSICTGTLHPDWKVAFVSPIFKAGDKSDVKNYRQVSVVSTFSKILEIIIRNKMFNHIGQYDLLSGSQHGFLKGRSVTTNLISCLADWIDSYDKGVQTDIMYLDFNKAFDSCLLYTSDAADE